MFEPNLNSLTQVKPPTSSTVLRLKWRLGVQKKFSWKPSKLIKVWSFSLRSESAWWYQRRVTWSGRRCTSSWVAAILTENSTVTPCTSAHTATSSSGRYCCISCFSLDQSQHGTEIRAKLKEKFKKKALIVTSVSFRRTQTIRAQPTTQKVALCRSPLKTLLTFLTSDTLPPPTTRRMNWLYILYIQMYNTDLFQGTIISWICI